MVDQDRQTIVQRERRQCEDHFRLTSKSNEDPLCRDRTGAATANSLEPAGALDLALNSSKERVGRSRSPVQKEISCPSTSLVRIFKSRQDTSPLWMPALEPRRAEQL